MAQDNKQSQQDKNQPSGGSCGVGGGMQKQSGGSCSMPGDKKTGQDGSRNADDKHQKGSGSCC